MLLFLNKCKFWKIKCKSYQIWNSNRARLLGLYIKWLMVSVLWGVNYKGYTLERAEFLTVSSLFVALSQTKIWLTVKMKSKKESFEWMSNSLNKHDKHGKPRPWELAYLNTAKQFIHMNMRLKVQRQQFSIPFIDIAIIVASKLDGLLKV